MAALGVAPVGAPKVTWGGNANHSTDWFDAQLATFGGAAPTRFDDADGNPVEEIARLAPDLILATNSGITKDEYDTLSKLAPVVAYPEVAYGTPWQASLETIGKALGRSTQAAAVEAKTVGALEGGQATYPQLAGKTFIYGYVAPTDLSQIGFYTPSDLRPQMLTELGMKNAPVVEKRAQGSTEFYLTVSAEQAVDARGRRLPHLHHRGLRGRRHDEGPARRPGARDQGGCARRDEGPEGGPDDELADAAVHPVHDRAVRAARGGRGRQGRRRPMSAPTTLEREGPVSSTGGETGGARGVGSARRRPPGLAVLLLALLVVAVVASIVLGSKAIPLGDVLQVLTGDGDGMADRGIVEARVARTVVGVLVGAGLAVAGAAMQGLTRNPLADPGLLGVNAGAGLAVVVAISVFGVGSLSGYVWWAMAGAGLAAVLVHALAGLARGGVTPLRLTLAGAAVSAGLASWSSGVLVSSKQSFDSFRFWQVGTIGGRGLDLVVTVLPFFAVGLVVVLLAVRRLNALALGDDLARGLGENVLARPGRRRRRCRRPLRRRRRRSQGRSASSASSCRTSPASSSAPTTGGSSRCASWPGRPCCSPQTPSGGSWPSRARCRPAS